MDRNSHWCSKYVLVSNLCGHGTRCFDLLYCHYYLLSMKQNNTKQNKILPIFFLPPSLPPKKTRKRKQKGNEKKGGVKTKSSPWGERTKKPPITTILFLVFWSWPIKTHKKTKATVRSEHEKRKVSCDSHTKRKRDYLPFEKYIFELLKKNMVQYYISINTESALMEPRRSALQ